MDKIRIFIDTDIGSDIDDTWALVYALEREVFEITGICVTGKLPAYRAAIVRTILQALHREDIPVYGGKCDCGEDIMPQARRISAADAPLPALTEEVLEELFARYPDVKLVALAPNSTLAAVAPFLKRRRVPVIAMAGSLRKGYFGSDTPVPECNVVTDMAASCALYRAGIDYTMLPLDVCGTIMLRDEDYRAVKASNSSAARIVMAFYGVWHEDYAGGAQKADVETSSTILYDLVPFWYLEYPENFSVENLNIALDEHGVMHEDPAGTAMRVATKICRQAQMETLTAQTIAEEKTHR